MNITTSWKKIIQTVSGGDYSPEKCMPMASQDERELISVPFPIEPLQTKDFHWINTFSDFLERRRKTVLMVTGLVILGTYGPACKDVCNILGEAIYLNQQFRSSPHRPAWMITRGRLLARQHSRKAQTRRPLKVNRKKSKK
jgi:hypothetical protein